MINEFHIGDKILHTRSKKENYMKSSETLSGHKSEEIELLVSLLENNQEMSFEIIDSFLQIYKKTNNIKEATLHACQEWDVFWK